MEKPRVTVRQIPGAALIELAGEHDVSTQDAVELAVAAIGPGEACVVDLSGAAFIDSSILAVLIRATSRHGACATTIVVAPPGSAAARLFELTQATSVVQVCPSLDEALDFVMDPK